jgi:hypothetical protein
LDLGPNALLRKAWECLSCINTAPMAKSLASVSRAKGLSKLGRANTGACTKDVFKVEKVLSCSEVQTNRVFSKKIGEGLADNPKMSDKLTVITSQA